MAAAQALYWDLVCAEEATDSPLRSKYQILPVKGGDVIVFEFLGSRSLLRRYMRASGTWHEPLDLPLVVNAAVPSPANPDKICILHCPSHWGSDHRYEVYALDTTGAIDELALEPLFVSSASKAQRLVEAGIAPKKRHAFSLAPFGCSLYFLCGLQHFPGDCTGSFVYCFSLDERVWTEVEYEGTFPATSPGSAYAGCRFGQSCVVHEGKAWLFGGSVKSAGGGAEPTSELWTFDLTEHRWDEVSISAGPVRPPEMSGHSALVCAGCMLVFGGDESSQEIYSYDMATSQWSLLPPILLGPTTADGRVVCCASDSSLLAYQQRVREASSPQSQWHELFEVGLEDLSRVLQNPTLEERPRLKTAGPQELEFLGDEASSDAAFMIDGVKMAVHSAVLHRFAPALARLFGGPQQRLVVLKGVQGSTFQMLLQHIYSRFSKSLASAEAELLLELAQHFELHALVKECQESILIEAGNVRHFLDIALSARPPLEMLNQKCIEYLTSHPEHLSLVKSPGRDRLASGQASPELQSARVLARSRAASELPTEASNTHQHQLQQHLQQHIQQQLQQLNQQTPSTLPLGKARPDVYPAPQSASPIAAPKTGAASHQASPLVEAAAAASAAAAAASAATALLREQPQGGQLQGTAQQLLQPAAAHQPLQAASITTLQAQFTRTLSADSAPRQPSTSKLPWSVNTLLGQSATSAQHWRPVTPGFTVLSQTPAPQVSSSPTAASTAFTHQRSEKI